jgi:hypothetical protein
LTLSILTRGQSASFAWSLTALLSLVGTQIIFWTFTYPADQQTNNWTVLPGDWVRLRNQWEYSHARSAGLNLLAVAALILSALTKRD